MNNFHFDSFRPNAMNSEHLYCFDKLNEIHSILYAEEETIRDGKQFQKNTRKRKNFLAVIKDTPNERVIYYNKIYKGKKN